MQTQSSDNTFPTKITGIELYGYKGSFCACCGAKRLPGDVDQRKSFKRTYRGIKVAPGVHCEPYDNGSQKVDVVQTKNGPITVSIRYAW